jgi:hypothetical protein
MGHLTHIISRTRWASRPWASPRARGLSGHTSWRCWQCGSVVGGMSLNLFTSLKLKTLHSTIPFNTLLSPASPKITLLSKDLLLRLNEHFQVVGLPKLHVVIAYCRPPLRPFNCWRAVIGKATFLRQLKPSSLLHMTTVLCMKSSRWPICSVSIWSFLYFVNFLQIKLLGSMVRTRSELELNLCEPIHRSSVQGSPSLPKPDQRLSSGFTDIGHWTWLNQTSAALGRLSISHCTLIVVRKSDYMCGLSE